MRITSVFKGWTRFEIAWVITAVATITTVSILIGDNWLGFISTICGILCVILAAKGKIATYFFGTIQAATYAYIAYGYQLYGEAMLNAFFFLPIQILGFYLWNKNKKRDGTRGEEVKSRRLTVLQWVLLVIAIVVAAGLYAIVLTKMNAAQVQLDSFAVVISVFAQILLTFRFAEQWLLWITVNVLTIILWFNVLVSTGGGDWAIFTMWVAFLVNSVYGYINWLRISKQQATDTTDASQPTEAQVL